MFYSDLPIGCSGLAIISRYPILEFKFEVFRRCGILGALDLECFAKKGIGYIKISINSKLIVDVYATHLISLPYNLNHAEKYKKIRRDQAKQMVDFVKNVSSKSNSDVVSIMKRIFIQISFKNSRVFVLHIHGTTMAYAHNILEFI